MRTLTVIVLTVVAVALPVHARGVDVQVTSSTQALWYADPLASDKNQSDIAQYIRVNAKLDDAGQVRVFGYGRAVLQLTTNAESGSDWYGRFYYLFLDYRDVVKNHLDLRAGRTFVAEAAIPGIVDGLYVNARNLGLSGLGVTAFGGHRATFDEKKEVDNLGDTLFGGSVSYDTVLQTHAELSYARRYTDGDFGREAVALQLSTTPHEVVNFLGRANYDLAESRWSELLLQANLIPWKPLTLRGEYYASRPTFDRFSFYSYFNVSRYEQAQAGVTLQLDPRYRLDASYAHEWFDAGASADLFDVGLTLRPLDALVLFVSYEKRAGYAGGIDGLRFNGSYRIQKLTVFAGADYSDFRRDANETAYGVTSSTAKRFWAGASYEINRYLGAIARIEDDLNFYFSHAVKGFVALNVNL